MNHRFILLLCLSIGIASCSSGNKRKPAAPPVPKAYPAGKVVKTVNCLHDASVSYALYLPSGYSANKKFPLILAFDPHASGLLPVERYKDLAEKYGYILMGSNNSKNGQTQNETATIVAGLFQEITTQFSVDTSRIYVMGFSGGARIASMIGLYRGGVAGVIGCGAGLPGTNQQATYKFDYIGFAGKGDFNMFELLKLDDQLERSGFRHALILFDGIHFWPPIEIMEKAFLWTGFCAMRNKQIPMNDEFINGFIDSENQLVQKAESKGDLLKAYNELKNTVRFLDGLTNLDPLKDKLKELENKPETKKVLKSREDAMNRELAEQGKYVDSFFTKDLKWWHSQITNYELRITNSKKPQDTLAARRMLSYLSLVAYMSSTRALSTNDTTDAAYSLKIYEWVDPENTEVYYLGGILNMREGKGIQAIQALKIAIAKGFNDKTRIQNQPEFESLKSNQEYTDLVQKMK
ncbi:MAG: hypothetical protein NTX61_10640 [Bacteroidetes bacterium]|nr:hypothetical protein [Bacteroidota bacterium]